MSERPGPGWPKIQSSPTPSVNSAEVEKLWSSPALKKCFGEEVYFDLRTGGF